MQNACIQKMGCMQKDKEGVRGMTEEKEVVKWDNKFWVLQKINEKEMAILWRNGQVAVIPKKEIKLM